MSDLEATFRRAIIAEVYQQAGDMDWDGLTDKQRSAAYDRWLDDPAIGGELTRFLSRERARVWLKDVPMKEYARARSGIGSFADLVTVRLPGPGQIARQVLGDNWDAVDGTIREKPNRCLISDGRGKRLMIWGPPKVLRDLIWAGITAIADGREPSPLIVVAAPRGESPGQGEMKRHVRIGEVAGLEVCHTTLRVTRVAPSDHDQACTRETAWRCGWRRSGRPVLRRTRSCGAARRRPVGQARPGCPSALDIGWTAEALAAFTSAASRHSHAADSSSSQESTRRCPVTRATRRPARR